MTETHVLVVAGPTASGKSALAVALARQLGGTIINADSMQVYRQLDILTARPDRAALEAVPHVLYGTLDGAEPCSAARWAELARIAIAEAVAAGRQPILCGGTGLYLRTLLDGIALVPEIPPEIRQYARARHVELGGMAFHAELARLDPQGASRLHPSDSQRLIRAYEVVKATGEPLSAWQGRAVPVGSTLTARTIVLLPPREALNARIDARFWSMIEAGALDEVHALVALGLDPALPVMKALGVPELAAHLRGDLSLADAVARAQLASRRYAKRQMTWFRHQIDGAEIVTEQLSEQNAGLVCQKICNPA